MLASRREAKKKRKRAHFGRWYGSLVRAGNQTLAGSLGRAPVSHATWPVELVVPSNLSILRSPVIALKALQPIERYPDYPQGTPVWIGMHDLEHIDLLGVLFLCSRIRSLTSVGCRVSGDLPSRPESRKILDDVDFMGFLMGTNSRRLALRRDGRQLELIQGVNLWVKTAFGSQIQEFLKERNPSLSYEEVDHVYLAVIECLENIQAHAYEAGTGWWYAAGHFDERSGTTSVAILDRGMGIVRSLTTGRWRLTFTPGSDLLEEATKGLRTEDGDPKRGKGLRTLREFVQRDAGRRFHVLTSGQMITWSNDRSAPFKRKLPSFGGTMVCIEIDSRPIARNA
jgi:anti-sigma regulatory factor (Ser/Thr protein kinase)